jgi:hypothetical protein
MPEAKKYRPAPTAITPDDIAPSKSPPPAASTSQRGAPGPVTSTEQLVPLGFKLDGAFVKQFKQAALSKGMKLNEFLLFIFHEFDNSRNRE